MRVPRVNIYDLPVTCLLTYDNLNDPFSYSFWCHYRTPEQTALVGFWEDFAVHFCVHASRAYTYDLYIRIL